jgi:hypothetical protein
LGADATHFLAHWAPNKIIATFVAPPAGVHEKRATIAAAHAALRRDGVLHLADYGAPGGRILHRPGLDSGHASVENSALSRTDSLIGLMRDAGFVAAERTESFPVSPAPWGAIGIYKGRIS